MKFFEYSQNNSGGHFDIDDAAGIGVYVIIEAENNVDADRKAQDIGLYFNGCDDEIDCSCCGDRWYKTYFEGDDIPMYRGTEVTKDNYENGWGDLYIHYANGEI